MSNPAHPVHQFGIRQLRVKGRGAQGPVHILTLLKRLRDTHALLTVIVHGAIGQYSRVLVDVNSSRSSLLLDERNTKLGHEQLLKHRRMRIIAQLHGVRLRFDGELESVVNDADGSAYRIALPETLHYLRAGTATATADRSTSDDPAARTTAS